MSLQAVQDCLEGSILTTHRWEASTKVAGMILSMVDSLLILVGSGTQAQSSQFIHVLLVSSHDSIS